MSRTIEIVPAAGAVRMARVEVSFRGRIAHVSAPMELNAAREYAKKIARPHDEITDRFNEDGLRKSEEE